jgi:hypothetical protein
MDGFSTCRVDLDLTSGFGEIDEVDLRFLALAEDFEFLVLQFAGCEGDDIPGGLRHLEVSLLHEIERIFFILIVGEPLEEFEGIGSFVSSWLALGGEVINHDLTIIFYKII